MNRVFLWMDLTECGIILIGSGSKVRAIDASAIQLSATLAQIVCLATTLSALLSRCCVAGSLAAVWAADSLLPLLTDCFAC